MHGVQSQRGCTGTPVSSPTIMFPVKFHDYAYLLCTRDGAYGTRAGELRVGSSIDSLTRVGQKTRR